MPRRLCVRTGNARRFGLSRSAVTLASLTAVASLVILAAPASADVTSVAGGAYGEKVDVTPSGSLPVQSGPLPAVTLPPAGGGPFTATVLSSTAPATGSILKTGLLQARTEGSLGPAGFVESSASVDAVDALQGMVTASRAESGCRWEEAGQTASTTVLDGTVEGSSVPVNPAPNTEIQVSGALVTLNQQLTSSAPGGGVTVNAIHIRVEPPLGNGEIVIGQSRCGASGSAPDGDGDGVSDAADNCPTAANTNQSDTDTDGQGDACDPDDDNDNVPDGEDECAGTPSGTQVAPDGCPDPDGDDVSTNAGDNCPVDANTDQTDSDHDGLGDVCDGDDDNDNVADGDDDCQTDAGGADNGCPLPNHKVQCKGGGWKNFGTTFKSQGECLAFVESQGGG